ncbi:MAG: hypothetical protein ACE3JN_13835 [Ectobacillus sp.]
MLIWNEKRLGLARGKRPPVGGNQQSSLTEPTSKIARMNTGRNHHPLFSNRKCYDLKFNINSKKMQEKKE